MNNMPYWLSSAKAKKLETNPINNAAHKMIVGTNMDRPCMKPKMIQYSPPVQTQIMPCVVLLKNATIVIQIAQPKANVIEAQKLIVDDLTRSPN